MSNSIFNYIKSKFLDNKAVLVKISLTHLILLISKELYMLLLIKWESGWYLRVFKETFSHLQYLDTEII